MPGTSSWVPQDDGGGYYPYTAEFSVVPQNEPDTLDPGPQVNPAQYYGIVIPELYTVIDPSITEGVLQGHGPNLSAQPYDLPTNPTLSLAIDPPVCEDSNSQA